MSEKQFTVGYFDEPVDEDSYVECDGEYLTASEVVGILNELQQDKNTLKSFFYELEQSGYWNEAYLTEQDWTDIKLRIKRTVDKLNCDD